MALMGAAQAGPLEGDMFGYKLDAKYPIKDKTKGRIGAGNVEIIADDPKIPPDFDDLEIIATAKTFRIGSTNARANFTDPVKAKAFAAKYADLLEGLYGKSYQKQLALPYEHFSVLCSGIYKIVLNYLEDSSDHSKVTVMISYYGNENQNALYDKEFKELSDEGRQKRLKSAEGNGSLRGLR